MKRLSILSLLVMTVAATILFAACGSPRVPVAEPTSPPVETGNEEPIAEEPEATEASTNEGTGGEGTGEETETGSEETGPGLDENGVPTDVPLMEGLYDLKVEANSTRIIYKIDSTIQEVVDFYAAEFEGFGWNKVLGADSAFGSMGTLSRENDLTDKLSILLSFNPNGNFVTVTIDIIRAQ